MNSQIRINIACIFIVFKCCISFSIFKFLTFANIINTCVINDLGKMLILFIYRKNLITAQQYFLIDRISLPLVLPREEISYASLQRASFFIIQA